MVVIIDYGMGNLFSIQSAVGYLGAESTVSSDPAIIGQAGKLILPGVGSFRKAMANLKADHLIDVIAKSVHIRQTPILGICLGMQLLGISSTEDGFSDGLGLIDTPVERFDDERCKEIKIPHVGFDTVLVARKSKLFDGLDSQVDFYFTHSYRMAFTNQPYATGICSHGEPFIAAFEQGHVCGTQFHPEKSQTNGLVLLKNFVEKF
ncbi:MAG: imidazole glycerol phosphate synthase subunit HisH [Pseudomonadota bacterium]